MKGQLVRKGVAALYAGPKITSYTDACEAPQAMWDGAIPLKQERVFKNGVATRIVKKTYSHPPEIFPANLSFNDVNSMYCLGNDELIRYFPEGLGGKVMQMMPPGHPRGFLYRAQRVRSCARLCTTLAPAASSRFTCRMQRRGPTVNGAGQAPFSPDSSTFPTPLASFCARWQRRIAAC